MTVEQVTVNKAFVATDIENHIIKLMGNGRITEILLILGGLEA